MRNGRLLNMCQISQILFRFSPIFPQKKKVDDNQKVFYLLWNIYNILPYVVYPYLLTVSFIFPHFVKSL